MTFLELSRASVKRLRQNSEKAGSLNLSGDCLLIIDLNSDLKGLFMCISAFCPDKFKDPEKPCLR
jgi:hypothetical protein